MTARLEGPLQQLKQQLGAREAQEGAEELQDLAQPQKIFSSARRHSQDLQEAQELSPGSAA